MPRGTTALKSFCSALFIESGIKNRVFLRDL